MEGIFWVVLIGILGGFAVGLQGPLASIIATRLGIMESIFIVHLGGTFLALLILIFKGHSNLGLIKTVPWYALCAGIFGLVVLGGLSYMIPKIGVSSAVITIVAGQIILGLILDHYGLLEANIRPITIKRLVGILVMFGGVWMAIK
jgi:bacterial/archaeal transporter family-2 protein